MSIFRKITWKTLWQNKSRTIVTIIGVILAAAMFTAVTTLAVSLRNYLIRENIYNYGDYYCEFHYLTDAELQAITSNPAVSSAAECSVLGFTSTQGEQDGAYANTYTLTAVNQTFFDNMPVHLLEGRLPENASEIVVPVTWMEQNEQAGAPVTLGSTVTLPVFTHLEENDFSEYVTGIQQERKLENRTFSKSYTIVGVTENLSLDDFSLRTNSILTCEGSARQSLWHRLFVKTNPVKAAVPLYNAEDNGYASINYNLLTYYSVAKYDNWTSTIYSFCVILIVIIMVGAISLIYSAFSISVSERTKQFGLLSSIGATRRQLRRMVFCEAGVVCLIGIPIGIACGIGGIGVTLLFTGKFISSLLSGSTPVTLTMHVSVASVLAAGLISCVTVLLSAWAPSRRAMRVTAIEAIRQSQDIKATRKNVKVSPLTYKLYGLSGLLAKKYYKCSRKKYRATIFSLVISIVLFISACTYGMYLRSSVGGNIHLNNCDVKVFSRSDDPVSDFQEVRALPEVENSVYFQDVGFDFVYPASAFDGSYQKALQSLDHENGTADYRLQHTVVYYMEDAAFLKLLEQNNLDSAPYFDASNPTALVCNEADLTGYGRGADGSVQRLTHHVKYFPDDAHSLTLLPYNVFSLTDVENLYFPGTSGFWSEESVTDDGKLILTLHLTDQETEEESVVAYEAVTEADEQGNSIVNYYEYNEETGKSGETPAFFQKCTVQTIQLGARLKEYPLGVTQSSSSQYPVILLMPYSMNQGELDYPFLAVEAKNHAAVESYVEGMSDDVFCNNFAASEENDRNLLTTIDVFAYGFIILISLISVANVFNTISTNVALRRRDFAMLRSVGMRKSDMNRMTNYECLLYGVRALVFGLPISLVISYWIWKVSASIMVGTFQIPWGAVAIAVGSVFFVVFSTMLYAMHKIKKDNPIDALKNENL